MPRQSAGKPPAPPPPAPEPAKGQDAPPPAPAPVPRICAHCLFWAQIPTEPGRFIAHDIEGSFGICRRKSPQAPTVFNMITDYGPFKVARAVWPLTYAGENCGEGEWRDA